MTRPRAVAIAALVGSIVLGLMSSREASARPTYFEVFTTRYGIVPGDRLYACGNCHFRWNGTGARNPFGNAVEQQLYVGKSIDQALADVEGADTDSDGFSNLDEIATFETLAGYNCDNFFLAENAPTGYDTYITPMVASCLEPIDIRIQPSSVNMITKAGTTGTVPVQVINNGSTDPITVTSFQLQPGTHAAFGVNGPATPFVMQVGEIVTLNITFSPASAVIAMGTLRIESNDPDEGTIDVPLQGFGFVQVLAPADKRARCFKAVDNQFRRYADRHRREWNRCFLDEIRGLACDTGARDLKIQQAETRFRDAIGGSKDKHCAGNGVSASLLGLPTTCGGECDITVNSLSTFVDCLVCRQDEARDDMLRDGIGTAPPDVPPNTVGNNNAYKCEKQITSRLAKGIGLVQKILGRCELNNVTSTPIDCAATHASEIQGVQAQVDEALARCTDSTGLLGCLFEGGGPTCLGDAAESIGAALVDVTFGIQP
jgi:hypothetical protein